MFADIEGRNRALTHWAEGFTGLIVDHCAQGVLQLDSAFQILQCNRQAVDIFGARHPGDLAGRPLFSHGEGNGIRLDPEFTDREGAPRNGEYAASSPFRADLPVAITFVALPEDPAGDTGWLLLVTDLTPQVEVERERLQAEKLAAMDNVVAGVAHELNNPMTAILGYAELLLSGETDPRRRQRAALIAEEADRCAKIIANMLTFTRSYGKKFESASLNAIVEEVVSLRAYQMRVDHVKIHAFYDPAIPQMLLQPDAIRRLLLNVIHNAHQALLEVPDTRRNFWAMTALHDGAVRIQIADDGPGIPESVRYKIFDPFFSTRPFGDGMGLGLSVAYGIAHEHKGKIWMEPRVGGGTAIIVELPLAGASS